MPPGGTKLCSIFQVIIFEQKTNFEQSKEEGAIHPPSWSSDAECPSDEHQYVRQPKLLLAVNLSHY